MIKAKKLILASHPDDEVLGCGGILDKDSFVYYCGIDEEKLKHDPRHRIGTKARIVEIKNVAEFLGFKFEINLNTKINYFKESDFINKFERLINELNPEKIFIPFPGYNQDHRTIYNAAQIALRPHDKNFFVKKVLVYEQPSSIIWENSPLVPNYFVPVDIGKKVKSYSLHKSQVRTMRSKDLLKTIAKLRGKSINQDYAEAFFIERWVD